MFSPSQHPFFRLQCSDGTRNARYVHTGVFSSQLDEYYNESASGELIDVTITRFETTDAIAFILYADGVPLLFTEVTRLQLATDEREQHAVHIIESCQRELSPESRQAQFLTPTDQLPVATI